MGGIQITSQVAGIGTGIGGGFENTNELRVMTYQEAMNTQDRDKWIKAVEEVHERMIKIKYGNQWIGLHCRKKQKSLTALG